MKFPERFRVTKLDGLAQYQSSTGDPFGLFVIRPQSWCLAGLKMMATDGRLDTPNLDTGFEHVSVSHLTNRFPPTWEEMAAVARLFWDDEECLVQYRPPKSSYVNHHPGCLHWWRPRQAVIPMPPLACV
jgi:hypothetical protein